MCGFTCPPNYNSSIQHAIFWGLDGLTTKGTVTLLNGLSPPLPHTIFSLLTSIRRAELPWEASCSLKERYQKHIRYIKQQDPQSAYALHILNNNHEYGPINTTMSLLKQITKTTPLIPHERFYI